MPTGSASRAPPTSTITPCGSTPRTRRTSCLGNDGGFYVSHDRGETWDFSPNLPVSQFYAVGLDMQEPFFGIYGGLQDNSTWGGPSRTRNSMGIGNADWIRMAGGDGVLRGDRPDRSQTSPSSSRRTATSSATTGAPASANQSVRAPRPGEDAYRFNWSSPIQLSPFDPATVYFAGNHVFKSTNRGDALGGPGRGPHPRDRPQRPAHDGRDPRPQRGLPPHQGTAVFSNISTMHVSSLRPGHIATGTDDGTISITTDDGRTWRKMTDLPGVPDTTYVSRVRWSNHDEATLYATLDGHRSNDFRPYVLKSTDMGESWTSIAGDLPEFGNVRAFAEHHEDPNLLFVGTEIRPFVSLNGGESWVPLENGIPPSPVHDLKIHPRDDALVVATHGRGFFVIDDLNAIRGLAEAKAAGGPYLFPVRDPLAYVVNTSHTTGTHADRNYSADNPQYGTTVSFLAPQRTPGERRLEIVATDGQTLRTLDAPDGSGLHQVQWNLRLDPPWSGSSGGALRRGTRGRVRRVRGIRRRRRCGRPRASRPLHRAPHDHARRGRPDRARTRVLGADGRPDRDDRGAAGRPAGVAASPSPPFSHAWNSRPPGAGHPRGAGGDRGGDEQG